MHILEERTVIDKAVDVLLETDSYKLGHKNMYVKNTEVVYSNLTARGTRNPDITYGTVFFGLQAFLYRLTEKWNVFFNLSTADMEEALDKYTEFVDEMLGPNNVGNEQFRELHELGHLPLRVRAFREGSIVPLRVPYFTIENTDERFFWLTNYLETTISANMWHPITSATIAWSNRRLLDIRAIESSTIDAVDFQGHDFSYRGMENDYAAAASGAGHLVSFKGTDTLPAIRFVNRYYAGDNGLVGASVPATEHAVMCSGIAVNEAKLPADYQSKKALAELQVFERLIDQHPSGILSIVADSFNLWQAIGFTYDLKHKILARDGKLVLRPDCYDDATSILTPRGWVMFNDLKITDEVAQVHPDGTYTFTRPLKQTRMAYNGYMVRFSDHHGKCDLLVTPNHRMLWKRRRGDRVVEAGASNVGSVESSMYRSAAAVDRGLKLSALDRFRIAFQADGSYPSKKVNTPVTGTRTYRFNFAKERKLNRLVEICEDGGFEYSIRHEAARAGQSTVYVKIPDEVTISKTFDWVDTGNLCGNWSREFIEELSYWDATRRATDRFKFDTAVPEVADVVELVALSAGYGVTRSLYVDSRKDHFSDTHCLHIMKSNLLGGQAITKSYQWYEGDIHCVTVPTGMLLVKRGRGTSVCGNSGDPELILCGDPNAPEGTPERAGVVNLLAEVFGTTVNDKGYKELDPHIGVIYGDSINRDRADAITANLMRQGYASTVPVFGFGSFCTSPDTKILCDDLIWREARSLRVGQGIIAFDEDPSFATDTFKRPGRGYRHATIEMNELATKPVITVETDNGSITVSTDHPFLVWAKNRSPETVFSSGKLPEGMLRKSLPRGPGLVWRNAEDLAEGDQIAFFMKPWETDESREGGWLAGMFDGEGCVSRSTGDHRIPSWKVNISQNEGEVLDSLKEQLEARGYTWYINERKCVQIVLNGGWREVCRFLGSIRPQRLLTKNIGQMLSNMPKLKQGQTFSLATVTRVGCIRTGEVSSIRTSSRTFITNGFLSHNTYQFQTRDTFKMAVKATWTQVDGRGYDILKDPITDDGSKKSATGRLAVRRMMSGEPYLIQNATVEQEANQELELMYENGKMLRHQSFTDVRETLVRETELLTRRKGVDG